MFCQKYEQDQKIITFGDMGNQYFVLMEGTVKVTVYEPGTNLKDPNLKDKIIVEKLLKADPNT